MTRGDVMIRGDGVTCGDVTNAEGVCVCGVSYAHDITSQTDCRFCRNLSHVRPRACGRWMERGRRARAEWSNCMHTIFML